jgi:hypothetical protein
MRPLRRAAALLAVPLFAQIAACSSTPPDAEPVAQTESAIVDSTTPAGTWYLRANGFRLELNLTFANGAWSGTIKNEGGANEPVSNITWDPSSRFLDLRRDGPGFFPWYRASVTFGVMNGRFSHSSASGNRPSPRTRAT